MTDPYRLMRELYSEPEQKLRPRLVRRAVCFTWVTAWHADRRRLLGIVSIQAASALGLGVMVLVGRGVASGVVQTATTQGGAIKGLVGQLAALGGVALLTELLSIAHSALVQVLQLKMDKAATEQVVTVAAAADLAEMENPVFHDRLQRAVSAAQTHLRMLVTVMFTLFSSLFTLVTVGAAVAVMAWWLLPIVAVAIIPAVRVTSSQRSGQFALALKLIENMRTRAYLVQVLTGRDQAKEVRAFGLLGPLRDRLLGRYADEIDQETTFSTRYAWRAAGARLAGDAVLAAAVAIMVILVHQHDLSVASAATSLGAVALLSSQARSATSMTGHAGVSLLFVNDLANFCAVRYHVPADADGEAFHELRANDVTFTYPAADHPALRSVSVTLKAGQVVALVGENGSGKTTLAKILCGLYEPDDGGVLLDGNTGDRARLRASSAVLFQDFQRYKLTVKDNIGFGRVDQLHDSSAIQEAARLAEADGLIGDLPSGYDTVLSSEFTGGVDLSLGQWQRIALARAFRRNAPFIVLDEPTAALDPRAEAHLFDTIRDLFTGKTVLLISHRFSSVRAADYIYVLQHGAVIEQGTHRTLMELDGSYAEMYQLQATAYLDHAASP